ncbi:MAG: alpha-L-fucosidase [Verrucomicrobiota bacterium]
MNCQFRSLRPPVAKPVRPAWFSLVVTGWVAATIASTGAADSVAPPAPYGPVPTARQLAWNEMEFYGFLHFTVNTFTDKEWGYGDEKEAVFNPTDFDADQIVRIAKEAGMKGVILTCKHHDGFCLWPSKFTEHSVKKSPWKDGKGDVVREISDACRRQGLKFGVYLSPWDRNQSVYGRPEYITYYRNQLRELLTNYGDIFTVWFDGANGGDGFYGGAREMRHIDNKVFYDWPNTWQIVRELMPGAVMFSDVGPDFRWVGNEDGLAGEPCWATINIGDGVPGNTKADLNHGERPGANWVPPECDVSIRPGWFYHASEDAKVKTPAKLLEIYYASVGRGACLNLNLPPDRRGRINEADVASLREFRRRLDATFTADLAQAAKVTASNTRGGAKEFAPANVLDGDRRSYWSTDDSVTTPELVLDLGRPVTFSVVSLREFLPLGQRVERFALDQWQDGGWKEFAHGTSIGNRRLVRGDPVTTEKMRLRITQAPVCPAIAEVGLFAEPADETPKFSVTVDYSKAPECEAFARKAQALCTDWYPKVNAILNGPSQPLPYSTVELEFAPMDGVAATGGNHIEVSAEWVTKKAPDDYGMVIHEMTHIVQDYHGKGAGWLTEGIADYIRDFRFEPGKRAHRINPEKNSYRQGYGVAAAFLDWLERTKHPGIVGALSRATRAGTYRPALFKECCGEDLDALWKEFASSPHQS